MKTEEKQHVADVLAEKPALIRVGLFLFKLRPLTLGQIYEMGAAANDINADDLEDSGDQVKRVRIMAALINHHKDAKAMERIFVICLFRKRWKRLLFGRYVAKRLTMDKFQQLVTYISTSFNANFFLTSIIFLRQATTMTEPSQTTALGPS